MRFRRLKFIKRFVPKTLFARSLLILVTPVLLIQIVSTSMFFDRHWSKMTSRLAFSVVGEISVLADYIEKNDGDGRAISTLISLYDDKLDLLVDFKRGEILGDQPEPVWVGWEYMIGESLMREMSGMFNTPFTVDVDFQEKWVEIRVQLTQGVLYVSLPQRRMFTSSSYIFLIWVFIITFVLLVISVLFMRNQVRPIRRLAIAAERFGKGRDVSDFKLEGAREVRQAGQAFLDMRTRIQRQVSQRMEMLAGVSHDLRTPLTRMNLQLAMLKETPDILAMKRDVNDMEKMVQGYLNFVRGEGDESMVVTNLTLLLQDVVDSCRRDGGGGISLDVGELGIEIPLKPMAFKRCLVNLLGNAVKYAPHTWVSLSQEEDRIMLVIEDNGIGIPKEQYEDVFKPFYRVDSSRNSETGGVGLGLPIAMDIVHGHGGKIWLEKSRHGGLRVNIRLPK